MRVDHLANQRKGAKYWLTGVLPAFRDGISPLTATKVISGHEEYQSLCGLTQKDVDAIVKRALRGLPESELAFTLDCLKSWYNGYIFSSILSSDETTALYNPQLVFSHLDDIIAGRPPMSYLEEANAVHTSTILSAVGETGPVTVHDLIGMLGPNANLPIAHIMTELSFDELLLEQEKRPKNATWSLLYYLGVVTFCKGSTNFSRLRVPNCTMVHLVSLRTCLGGCDH